MVVLVTAPVVELPAEPQALDEVRRGEGPTERAGLERLAERAAKVGVAENAGGGHRFEQGSLTLLDAVRVHVGIQVRRRAGEHGEVSRLGPRELTGRHAEVALRGRLGPPRARGP